MRVGLIGAGSVGRLHAMAAHARTDVAITAVCDLDPLAAAEVAAHNDARVFTDNRALMTSGLVDAVIICTPHALHLDMVGAAAERGLHVLVEKPMATTTADSLRMVEYCHDADVVLAVGHIQHFVPDKVAAHRFLAEEHLGRVLLINDRRSTDYRPGSRPSWFFDRDAAGGGAWMNVGAHCVDRTLWLAQASPTSVHGATAQRWDAGVETDVVAHLALDTGAAANIALISTAPKIQDEITLICERGTLTADPRVGTFAHVDGEVRTLHIPTSHDITDAFHAQLGAFAACVLSDRPFPVTLNHSITVVDTVLATYSAAQRNSGTCSSRFTNQHRSYLRQERTETTDLWQDPLRIASTDRAGQSGGGGS